MIFAQSLPPLIGVTLDWEAQGSFSTMPYYCLRQHYFDAIINRGGLPIALPHHEEAFKHYSTMLDGLVITGGDFAFPDNWYKNKKQTSPFNPSPRLHSDMKYLEFALKHNIPVLGICAGMQILGCTHDCLLTSAIQSTIDHHKGADRTIYAHDITIKKDTLLHKIIQSETMEVNSAHCEAIITPSKKVIVSATASDGTIEAIELPNYNFVLGVQWHPEIFLDLKNTHSMIFDAFIKKCRTKRQS